MVFPVFLRSNAHTKWIDFSFFSFSSPFTRSEEEERGRKGRREALNPARRLTAYVIDKCVLHKKDQHFVPKKADKRHFAKRNFSLKTAGNYDSMIAFAY